MPNDEKQQDGNVAYRAGRASASMGVHDNPYDGLDDWPDYLEWELGHDEQMEEIRKQEGGERK